MLEDTTAFQSDVEIYNKYTPYLVAVDCIIFGFIESEIRLLIVKRVINPCKGLQSLYEAIYQQKFDKRNFRKSILKMNLLDQLDEKNKEDSKKGAWLYRFNEEKYKELLRQGFFFNIPV